MKSRMDAIIGEFLERLASGMKVANQYTLHAIVG